MVINDWSITPSIYAEEKLIFKKNIVEREAFFITQLC